MVVVLWHNFDCWKLVTLLIQIWLMITALQDDLSTGARMQLPPHLYRDHTLNMLNQVVILT